MKYLSIIILTYNSEKDIYDCLSSVYQFNDIGSNLEVIVVDNQSLKFYEMKQKIQQLFPDTIVIQNSKNGGYGQGNNIGIRAAHAPYIAIMNPDIRLTMPVFAEMTNCLQQKNVVMCAGKQFGGDGSVFTSFFSLFTVPWWFGKPLEYISRRIIDTYFYKLQYLSGAFFAIRRDIFETIGMFDENIFMYAEENDIHYRIRQLYPKMKMKYLKHLKYIHLAEKRPFNPIRIKRLYESSGYFFKKNNMSNINYWTQQIILNKFLIFFYQFRNLLKGKGFKCDNRLKEHNIILANLISQEKTLK